MFSKWNVIHIMREQPMQPLFKQKILWVQMFYFYLSVTRILWIISLAM